MAKRIIGYFVELSSAYVSSDAGCMKHICNHKGIKSNARLDNNFGLNETMTARDVSILPRRDL